MVGAFARYLGQARPDLMVSDELRPAPEPVATRVPHQVQLDQARQNAQAAVEQARRVVSARAARMWSTTSQSALQRDAEAEAHRGAAQAGTTAESEEPPSWKDRPYGAKTDTQLAATIKACLSEARQQDLVAKTREDCEALRKRLEQETAEGLTRGGRWAKEAGAVLDTAVGHLRTAIEEASRVRWATESERQARAVLPDLDRQMEASWLALRLAGNSKKEVKELREHYLAQALGSVDEQMRARRASDEARLAAWRTVKESPYAQALGATGFAQRLDDLPQALAAMRTALSQQAQQMDTRDETKLSRLAGAVRSAVAEAADWRGHAALAVSEQQRRQLLAEKHPDVHRAESVARQIAADAQQRQQAAVRAPREVPAAVPPVQQQKGPRTRF
ncbi:hypothetical protein [Streptomyces exfoliatus]|uniref:hypothetical protein n=1 Tax=Streptomyces exfoliatus TaxID=1905 RepID=UPI003C2E75A7